MTQSQLSCIVLLLILPVGANAQDGRIVRSFPKYSIAYVLENEHEIPVYQKLFDMGVRQTENFFGKTFMQTFVVNLHPSRASLDRQWQNDWKMPDFKSEAGWSQAVYQRNSI